MTTFTPPQDAIPRGRIDVLSLPFIGRLLKWRYGRLMFQLPMAVIALLLVYDGFTGPARPAENLATVLPWVHYRGFVVVALLLAGNLFCMGCPFTLPRTLAKRLSLNKRRFPRVLRGKWLAIAGLFGLFFAYEWLDMWASPALTAWVIVAYFVASFAFEAFFGESAFCKYVCPLGTFNYVYATAAPTQITSKNLDICRSCVGKECVNGSYSPEPVIRINEILGGEATITHDRTGTPGCGTQLFVPQIKSNLDCVLCLDCARACPHDNVSLMLRTPGRELTQPEAWSSRWDVSYLVISLAFMGVINAFGMIPPVYALMQNLADALGLVALGFSDLAISGIVLLLIFAVGGLLLPALAMFAAGVVTRALVKAKAQRSLRHTIADFAPAFVPVGFAIWMGHYGFHFFIGAMSIIPVMQTFLIDHRIYLLGTTPDWTLAGLIPETELIGLIQVVILLGGFLWSMAIAQKTALRLYRRDATMAFLPWAIVILALMLAAVAVFSQPMEMRGTILFS